MKNNIEFFFWKNKKNRIRDFRCFNFQVLTTLPTHKKNDKSYKVEMLYSKSDNINFLIIYHNIIFKFEPHGFEEENGLWLHIMEREK